MWESILLSILGNAAYDVLKKRTNIVLKFFGYEKAKIEEEKPFIHKANVLLTPYPKPIENEVKGRDNDLTEIELLLGNSKDVLLLSGMGGIGKTTLAAYYIQQNIIDYDTIAWMNTSQGFYEAFAFNNALIKCLGIADKLNELQKTTDPKDYPQTAYDEIIYQLNQRNGKLLMVIDNAIEGQPLQTLRDGLKREWKLLVTAREPLGGFTQYQVDILKEGAAIELFNSHYTREKNKKFVKEILQRVAYHTLSIELIAKTAQQKMGYTLQQLKADLESKGLTVAKGINVNTKYSQVGGHEEYKTHIMGCLQTAFDVAQLGDNENYIYALKNLCLLPTVTMHFDFIADLIVSKEEEEINHFNTTLNDLVAKGWLEKIEEEYKLHPVLQETLQSQLQPQAIHLGILINSLAERFNIDENSHGIERVLFIPYAESVLAYFFNKRKTTLEYLDDGWDDIARLTNNFSVIYRAKGDFAISLEYQKRVVEIFECRQSKNDLTLASIYNNISLSYKDNGDIENALKYQKKSIEVGETILDSNHPTLARFYNNISGLYMGLDLEKALEYQQKAIRILEKKLNGNHPDLARSFNLISETYRVKKDLKNALKYQQKAIEIRESILDENHPDLAISYNNFGLLHKLEGDIENALKFQKNAIRIFENTLGKTHPNLAISYSNLSALFLSNNDFDNALYYLRKALEIFENVLEVNHPDLAVIYAQLAFTYSSMRQNEKAAEYNQKSQTIKEFNKQRGWG